MTVKKVYFDKRIVLALIAGLIIGSLWLIAVRFATYKSDNVHYHANFALYINGQRDEFKSFTFYEEVQACNSDQDGDPRHRVHMHNEENNIIHVHAPAVTWGHFFANLGYGLSGSSITTDKGTFVDGQNGKQLTFLLNGQEVSDIANRVIGSEDVLLINYGDDQDVVMRERSQQIPKTAGEYNGKFDPSGCKGNVQLTFWQRLKQAIGVGSSH